MIKNPKDWWTGLLYLFFGGSAMIIAQGYPLGTATKMGPAYFPTVLGGILILIGLISLARSFIQTGAPIEKFALKGLALILLSTVLFGVIVRGAGLAVALPLLVIISSLGSRGMKWLPRFLLALSLTVFCVLVFLKGLGIPLAVIGPWLGG